MSVYMPMSASGRHSRFIMTISSAVVDFMRRKEVYALQDSCALVHWGYKDRADFKSLIDLSDIEDHKLFVEDTINELDYIQPDFMLFKSNPYVHNANETKIAGCPDLLIEVWSKGNTPMERNFKYNLYSTSPVTEHWYITQDSNLVECYYGNTKISVQTLSNILISLGGIEFDLRYLAL